jgi:Zn-dependent protease with chaperone function/tetratricopeptide (TPR) repeat protein
MVRHERPLSGTRKTALAISGIAIAALCYIYSMIAILLLLLLLGIEMIYLIVAARFGLAGAVTPLIRRHGGLLSLFVRSFWRGKYTDYRLLIVEEEAPRLFASVETLARRFNMPPPKEVSVEMDANAWVRLRGFRQGSGQTILSVGYDLLAGLSENEVEAVLAHEMGHVRFVRRGFKRWLEIAVSQISFVTSRLSSQAETFRSSKKRFHVAEILLLPADALTRIAARVLATSSRQDEFEADRVSAELFGPASLRSALTKLRLLHEKLARLPWTERIAQVEVQKSFSQWLSRELAIDAADQAKPIEVDAHDPYSTHPSLRDRIAALPPDDRRIPNNTPGIHFLADPDRIASKLIAEIHRIAAEEEQKDTKALARWTRKTRRNVRMRPGQWPGLVLIIAAIFFYFVLESRALAAVLVFSSLTAGVLVWRWGRYRDAMRLPVPRYGEIKNAWQAERRADMAEREERIEAELIEALSKQSRKKTKLRLLTDEGARALAQCDYLRAHIASRLAIDINKWKIEGALINTVAAAGLGAWDSLGHNLEFLRQNTGLDTPSTRWGAAWAFLLAGDWATAESLLWKATEEQPRNTTFLCLLALSQSQRGKVQSAILNARKAADIQPDETENTKLLTRLLLDAGRLTEAAARLDSIRQLTESDAEAALLVVRLHLMRHEFEAAAEAAGQLRKIDGRVQRLLQLGEVFEVSRQDQQAGQFYREALVLGHYPEALLSLARLAANQKRPQEARDYLLSALDVDKAVGPQGRTSLELFHVIAGQLTMLEEPREQCSAWIVTFPPGTSPEALAERSLMMFARTRTIAEQHLDFVLKAMRPNGMVTTAAELQWRDAPRDQQPARPVREGVQFVL